MPFVSEDGFDRRINDLLIAIAAEQQRCVSDSEVRVEVAGER